MIGPRRRTRLARRLGPPAAAATIVLIAVAALSWAGGLQAGSTATPSPSRVAFEATPPATEPASPTPSPTPTAAPTPTPSPPPVAATTDGIWLPADQATRATRHPIAVMIDDHADARPQAGLASADIVYQAPAEGGIPRYLAVFQTEDPPTIGPVRSSRLYFVAWAAEWRALYVHVGGAPNALAFLRQVNGRLVYDADEYRWGGAAGYLWRVTTRASPHNVYSSGKKLQELARRVGATSAFSTAPWTFKDDVAYGRRPTRGSIVVPYLANRIAYTYDPFSNRYRRAVTGEKVETDAGSREVVAPANVVVLMMAVGALVNSPSTTTNEQKHRLEIRYTGSGDALVFNDGRVIKARWSKASDGAPTLLTYASGSLKGKPVPLVRGQVFVQVVPTGTAVTYSLGPVLPRPPGVGHAE